MHDISRGGVGLCLRRRFERGTILVIELPSVTAEGEPRTVIARVLHVQRASPEHWDWVDRVVQDASSRALGVSRAAEDRWFLGCALLSMLDKEDLTPQIR